MPRHSHQPIKGGEWTEERDQRLTLLWTQGTSVRTIAEQLCLTIPTIESRARVLKLSAQPRFARRNETYRAHMECCWPTLHAVTDKVIGFCGDPVERGKPYCSKHVTVAYRRRPRAA